MKWTRLSKVLLFLSLVLLNVKIYSSELDTQLTKIPQNENEISSWNRMIAGLRIDCLYFFQKETENQECFKLTGVKLGYKGYDEDRQSAYILSFNPLSTNNENYRNSPFIQYSLDGEIQSSIVDDLYFGVLVKNQLEIAIEKYRGSQLIGDTSGLSFGSIFYDRGWDQTAVSLASSLAVWDDLQMKLIWGNGESKVFTGTTTQHYVGAELRFPILPYLIAGAQLAFNGNSVGGESYLEDVQSINTNCGLNITPGTIGYSTKRTGVSLVLDGKEKWARGFRAGMAWQNVEKKDLDETKDSYLSIQNLSSCKQLDEDTFFVEDSTHQKAYKLARNAYMLNAQYRILDSYFVGLDYEWKTLTGAKDFFGICETFTGNTCTKIKTSKDTLNRTAWATGFGMERDDGLTFVLEYMMSQYSEAYENFYVDTTKGPSKIRKVINLRLSYKWE
jgi:hypothetical protein